MFLEPRRGRVTSTRVGWQLLLVLSLTMDFSAKCLENDTVKTEMEELQHEIDASGVSNIEELLRKRLERWREVEVNIAITGNSCTGKSSFINAIRGLKDDDEKAAKVGVTQTTSSPTAYACVNNPKILFWDLPGIGTPNYPNLETYVEKVKLEKYDTFLILTASCFTNNDLLLAKKIRSMKKSFFFIRTKIDENVRAESRQRSFDEEAMLLRIRHDCSQNLGDLLSNEERIFLISNHEQDKWDFERLNLAIPDAFTRYQRESLTLSLGEAIKSSKEIVQRKVNVLKARIWKVAAFSAAVAIAPLPGLSFGVDAALIFSELDLYRSQLGLPPEGSAEFEKLDLTTKGKVLQVGATTAAQLNGLVSLYAAEGAIEEAARYLPFVGLFIASSMSFVTTYSVLYKLMKAVEEAALSFLSKAHKNTSAELKS